MTNQFTNNKKISALLYMLVGLFSLLIFLKNAWVTEDAFIILRSVDQFLLGHGFRWNPHERVQVYTSPLWYLLIIASTFFCKTLYYSRCHRDFLTLPHQGWSIRWYICCWQLLYCFTCATAPLKTVIG